MSSRSDVALSVVVVVHDMERELPRTLASLRPGYQAGIATDDYEIIVVDNGSRTPVRDLLHDWSGPSLRVERIDDAPPSPAHAANVGLGLAGGELVGLIVDGARLASPGLLAWARRAAGLAARPVITAPAFHLGAVPHMKARDAGYDQAAEDALLARTGWERDGYALFGVSTPGGSSSRGLFGPMGESSSLFTSRGIWDELGGLDERFALPGGGLVNHDLYRRACGLDDVELLLVLGEATFHQFHGGAATSRRLTWDEMHDEYQAIRGVAYVPPPNEPTYLGRAPATMLEYVEQSARKAADRRDRRR